MKKQDEIEKAIVAYYDSIDDNIKENLVNAIAWATKTLESHEGKGHEFYIIGTENNLVVCSFAKPQWAGDHCGRPMEHGSLAIVMAVSEYLNGG